MTTRLVILSGLLLCGSLASGKNELSFKETVVPVKVAPDQDSITASFPFTNTSGTPVTISKIHVSCDCTTAGAKDNKLTYAPGESGVISAVMKTRMELVNGKKPDTLERPRPAHPGLQCLYSSRSGGRILPDDGFI